MTNAPAPHPSEHVIPVDHEPEPHNYECRTKAIRNLLQLERPAARPDAFVSTEMGLSVFEAGAMRFLAPDPFTFDSRLARAGFALTPRPLSGAAEEYDWLDAHVRRGHPLVVVTDFRNLTRRFGAAKSPFFAAFSAPSHHYMVVHGVRRSSEQQHEVRVLSDTFARFFLWQDLFPEGDPANHIATVAFTMADDAAVPASPAAVAARSLTHAAGFLTKSGDETGYSSVDPALKLTLKADAAIAWVRGVVAAAAELSEDALKGTMSVWCVHLRSVALARHWFPRSLRHAFPAASPTMETLVQKLDEVAAHWMVAAHSAKLASLSGDRQAFARIDERLAACMDGELEAHRLAQAVARELG